MKKKYISTGECFDILKDSIKDIEEDDILRNIKLNEIKFSLVNEINQEEDDELGWFGIFVFYLKYCHNKEFIKVVKLIKHNTFKHEKFSNNDKEYSLIMRNVLPIYISQN
jgi:hypothetical protein